MTEFFTKQGGAALLNDSNTKKKYSSRQGQLYREELERRVQEDADRWVCFLLRMKYCGMIVVSRTSDWDTVSSETALQLSLSLCRQNSSTAYRHEYSLHCASCS